MKLKSYILVFITAISAIGYMSAYQNIADRTYTMWRNQTVPDLLQQLQNANNNDAPAIEQKLTSMFTLLNAQEPRRVRAVADLYQQFQSIVAIRGLPAPAALPAVPLDPGLIAPEDRPASRRVIPYAPSSPSIPGGPALPEPSVPALEPSVVISVPAVPAPAPQPSPALPEAEEPTPPAAPAKPSKEDLSSKKSEEGSPKLPGQQAIIPGAIPQPRVITPVISQSSKEIAAALKDAQDKINALDKYKNQKLVWAQIKTFASEIDAADKAGGNYLNLVGKADLLEDKTIQENRKWILDQLEYYTNLYEQAAAPADIVARPAMPIAKTDKELREEKLNKFIADAKKIAAQPVNKKTFNNATKLSKDFELYVGAFDQKRKTTLINLKKLAVDSVALNESNSNLDKQIEFVTKYIVDLAQSILGEMGAPVATSAGSGGAAQEKDLKDNKEVLEKNISTIIANLNAAAGEIDKIRDLSLPSDREFYKNSATASLTAKNLAEVPSTQAYIRTAPGQQKLAQVIKRIDAQHEIMKTLIEQLEGKIKKTKDIKLLNNVYNIIVPKWNSQINALNAVGLTTKKGTIENKNKQLIDAINKDERAALNKLKKDIEDAYANLLQTPKDFAAAAKEAEVYRQEAKAIGLEGKLSKAEEKQWLDLYTAIGSAQFILDQEKSTEQERIKAREDLKTKTQELKKLVIERLKKLDEQGNI